TPAGNPIALVFGPFFQSADSGVAVGVAVTGTTGAKNGTWQFSITGGAAWAAFPAVSATSALLLSATDQVRFVPATGFAGTAALSGIAIVGSTGPGVWQWQNGSTWTPLPAVSSTLALLLSSKAQLRFVPANHLPLNTNGSATLTFLAWDQTMGTAGTTLPV